MRDEKKKEARDAEQLHGDRVSCLWMSGCFVGLCWKCQYDHYEIHDNSSAGCAPNMYSTVDRREMGATKRHRQVASYGISGTNAECVASVVHGSIRWLLSLPSGCWKPKHCTESGSALDNDRSLPAILTERGDQGPRRADLFLRAIYSLPHSARGSRSRRIVAGMNMVRGLSTGGCESGSLTRLVSRGAGHGL